MIIGFTASTFDLLHAGHVSMLSEAKSVCDYLMVGLHVDPSRERKQKNKPVQSLVERYIQLSVIKYVDEIIPYETEDDLTEILQAYPISIRIIGEEYRDNNFTGKNLEMKIHYNKRRHGFSTSLLRKNVLIAEGIKR
jgi:glycerol-3-phosphate cytidylyltransferase